MPDESTGRSGIGGWIDRNPTLALGGIVIAVLLIGALFLRNKAAAPPTSGAGVANDLSGLTNGMVYVPTSTNFTTYNATDASQTVSNTGPGNVTTGSSSAGNTTPILQNPVSGTRQPVITAPRAVSIQWSESVTSHNQSLNRLAQNAQNAQNANLAKLRATQRITVTGQQVYNHNSSAVNAAFARAHKTVNLNDGVTLTGTTIILPQAVLS